MNFVFGALLIVALATGKAYFRGVYARDENPRRYWTIVGCYAVLSVSGMVLPLAGSAHREKDDGTSTGSHFWLPFDLLTDAATRLAGELDGGAARARRAPDGRATIVHRPKASPEGCAEDYRVQLTKDSALVVWCSSAGKVTSSHVTTSHLPAVSVPQTWVVDKRAGEALTIALEKHGERMLVTGVE